MGDISMKPTKMQIEARISNSMRTVEKNSNVRLLELTIL
jgi:hypothetical protein